MAYPKGYKYDDKHYLLQFDNAPSHQSSLLKSVLAKLPFNPILNPEYSPDVSPMDLAILGTVKNKMLYESIDSEESLNKYCFNKSLIFLF